MLILNSFLIIATVVIIIYFALRIQKPYKIEFNGYYSEYKNSYYVNKTEYRRFLKPKITINNFVLLFDNQLYKTKKIEFREVDISCAPDDKIKEIVTYLRDIERNKIINIDGVKFILILSCGWGYTYKIKYILYNDYKKLKQSKKNHYYFNDNQIFESFESANNYVNFINNKDKLII